MKKLLSVVLATLMLISVFPLALPQNVTAATTERIAYLDAANGDDTTAELGNKSKAFATFEAAYGALCPEGGTLMLISPYEVTAEITNLAHHYKIITVTAETKSEDYLLFNKSEATLKCAGPVTFTDIRLVAPSNFYILGNYNHIIMDEGVSCENTLGTSLDGTYKASKISVLGGTFTSCAHADTKVTIRSGNWRAVAGGGRTSRSSKTTAYLGIENGTYQTSIEGGYIANLFGTNWATSNTAIQVGGQAYINFSGGAITALWLGGQQMNHASVLDSVLVYTGGEIVGTDCAIRGTYCTGELTLVYGGDVSGNSDYSFLDAFNIPGTGTSARVKAVLKNGDKTVDIVVQNGINIVPLAEAGATVCVSASAEDAAGTGAEDDPVKYLHQAIAMVSENGGTVKLLEDYTFSTFELSQTEQFVEFPHSGDIVIDGDGHKLIGVATVNPAADEEDNFTVNGKTYKRRYGLASYWLNGNTTFTDLIFENPRDLNIVCNFNSVVMDNVECAGTNKTVRIEGGAYLYGVHFDYGRQCGYNHTYQYYNDGDTHITVNSGIFSIYGFTRFGGGYIKTDAVNANDPVLHYPGTAYITVTGGSISNIFPASSHEVSNAANRVDLTSAAAVINIGGNADVDALWTGGIAENAGSIAGDLIYNISGNCTIQNFGAIDNCDGTRYYNINNNMLTYLKAEQKYAGAKDKISLNTSLRLPVFLQKGFGYKNVSEDSYALRANFSIESTEYFVENGDKYNIVEMGVLVKAAENTNSIKYIKGKDFYTTAIEAVENTENYDPATLIAKSVAYIKDADVNNYRYAGEGTGDNFVYFSAPITELTSEHLDTQFVFVPYVVLADAVDGEHVVYYGTATDAVSYNNVVAMAQ